MTKNNIEAPVFLVGALRSGTTVTHLMLDSHPRISNQGEYDFFFDYISDAGVPPDSETLLKKLENDRIYQYSGLEYDVSLDYKSNLLKFFRQMRQGKNILIINIHRNYHKIIKIFPDARFIHLVRDPRDVARSSVEMGWAGNVYYGVDHWVDSENSWDRLATKLRSDQFMQFTFEELITDPDDTLMKICDFIGVEFTTKMYDYQHLSTYSKPDRNLVGQWKTKLSAHEIGLVETKAANLMSERGYSLMSGHDSASFNPGEKLFLFSQNKLNIWKDGCKRNGMWVYFAEKVTRRLYLEKQHAKILNRKNAIEQSSLK